MRVFDVDSAEAVEVDKSVIYDLAYAATPTYVEDILSPDHLALHPRCRNFVRLKRDIRDNGILTPLVVYYDANGYARLHDGNHRIVAAHLLRRIKTVPVMFVEVEDSTRSGYAAKWEPPVALPYGEPWDILAHRGKMFDIDTNEPFVI